MVAAPRQPTLRFDDGGWAQAVGNHVALDLVNTVAWRLHPARAVDRLPDGAALVRWAQFVGLVDDRTATVFTLDLAGDPAAGDRITARVRRMREQLYRVAHPLALGEEPAREDVDTLHRGLLEALGRLEVTTPMPLDWASELRTVRELPDQLGRQIWRLLEREDPARIRQCHDDVCGWLFLDRTKNASRVWCSSADCGNRTRARRHYQRHATEQPR